MQFNICENTGFFLRMGLVGPSGSGKTYTALSVATALGCEHVGIIDTENKSARRYARDFAQRFLSLELERFSPRDYIQALRAAEEAGVEVLIIDSLSHAWMGKGGVLEMVDQSAKRQSRGGAPSSFNGWREVTPEHNRLVEALVQAPMHLLVTMRVKTEYVVEQVNGKSVPRKVGLAPVQRDGLEYEFDIVGDMTPEHELCITKSRCPALADQVIARPGTQLALALRGWLDGSGGPPSPPPAAPEAKAPPTAPAAPAARASSSAAWASDKLRAVTPWLERIEEAAAGTEAQLDAVRQEMNRVLRRRTRAQGDALRQAIETARCAIRSRPPTWQARMQEGEDHLLH